MCLTTAQVLVHATGWEQCEGWVEVVAGVLCYTQGSACNGFTVKVQDVGGEETLKKQDEVK